MNIKYNIKSGDVCTIGHQWDHYVHTLEFEGYKQIDEANPLYLVYGGRPSWLIPVVDNKIDIVQRMTLSPGRFVCQLVEKPADGTVEHYSRTFRLQVLPSKETEADRELTDDRMETLYSKYQELYTQLATMRDDGSFTGPMGPKGADGTMVFDELTDEQIEMLRGYTGPKGDPFTYADFTPEQLEGLRGPKGADGEVTFQSLTPEQIAQITGPQGEQGVPGIQGPKGDKGDMLGVTYGTSVPDPSTGTVGDIYIRIVG